MSPLLLSHYRKGDIMNQIGVYGMGVMGQSLAHNIARKGYSVSVYNIEKEGVDHFLNNKQECETAEGFIDVNKFVASLQKPRIIIMMVTAGKVVDIVIDQLKGLLDKGDILIDCGNSYYKDSIRRYEELNRSGLEFFGVGVSGGEKGALEGPSIMPSGNKEVYDKYLKDLFDKIAAKNDEDKPCVTYIGPCGSGHFVKMVHNGIEYGDIEIICEAYDFMKKIGRLTNSEIQKIFAKWNEGRLKSYLIEITANILKVKDDKTGNDLIDMILDEAGQKGTGKWTSIEALDLGVAIPTIAESVFARYLSSIKNERVKASKLYKKETVLFDLEENWIEQLELAIYASKISSYAQGFALIKRASDEYNWDLDYAKIAQIWENGCIIRADFLKDIDEAFTKDHDLSNLLLYPCFKEAIEKDQTSWRKICALGSLSGLYMPVISGSLNYFDGYTSERLPANLLQAQRDYFGAHTYKRIDEDYNNNYHTKWE